MVCSALQILFRIGSATGSPCSNRRIVFLLISTRFANSRRVSPRLSRSFLILGPTTNAVASISSHPVHLSFGM